MHSPPAPVKMRAMSDVTQILSVIEQGDPKAAEKLLPLVYEELRKSPVVVSVLVAKALATRLSYDVATLTPH
jgi:hypothetical protein